MSGLTKIVRGGFRFIQLVLAGVSLEFWAFLRREGRAAEDATVVRFTAPTHGPPTVLLDSTKETTRR